MVDENPHFPIREGCPEPEAIAAYVDGRLSGPDKAEIETHLASCDDCFTVFSETARSEVELGKAAAAVVRPRFGRRWIVLAAAAALVAAAVPLALRVRARRRVPPDVAELVAAVGPERPFEPRLTGGFAYGPMAPRYRSAKPLSESESWEVLAAAAKIRKKDEERSTPATLDALGAANLILGKYDDAVSNLEEATLEEPKDARYLTDLSAAYLVRAGEKGRADDYPKALEAAEKATELDPSILEAWFNRALALEEMHLKGEAIKAWREYIDRDPKSPWAGEAKRRRDALVSEPSHSRLWIRDKPRLLAAAKTADSETVEEIARNFTQETRELIEREVLPSWADLFLAGRTVEAASTLRAVKILSVCYSSASGDSTYEAAIAGIEQAVEAGSAGRDIAVGIVEFRDAWNFYVSDDIDHAVTHFERSRDVLSSSGSRALRDLSSLYLAACEYYQGHHDEANDELKLLISSADRSREISLEGHASWLAGTILDREGHFAESLQSYRRALERLERVRGFGDCADLHSLIAQDLNSLGESEASWFDGERALRMAPWSSDPDRRHTLYTTLSLVALAEGRPRAALYLQRTASSAESLGTSSSVRAETRIFLSRIHSLLGRFAESRRDLDGAERWANEVRGEGLKRFVGADLLAAKVEAGKVNGRGEAIEDLSRSLASFTGMHDRFPVAQLLLERGRLFRSEGRPEMAARDFESGIEDFEHGRYRQSGHEISYFDRSGTLFEEMVSLQAEDLHDSDRALEYLERLKARSLLDAVSHAAGGRARPVPMSEIRASLDSGERLVYFATLRGRLLSWVVTREGGRIPHFSTTISMDALNDLVRRARRDCRSADGGRFPGAAETQLYDLLVRPLADDLAPGAPVIIVPDNVLAPLPFAALFDARTGRFFFQDHVIAICPGGSYLSRMRQNAGLPREGALSVLAVGDPLAADDEMAHLGALPEAEKEASQTAAIYPRFEVLTGREATVGRFLADAGAFDVVHFAGHALVNPEFPELSHLVFARGPDGGRGDLFARDLVHCRFPKTRLVVLSACSTAEGPASPGEGMLSLARPLLAAGVGDVVASLWDVDDDRTRALMTEFHRNLLRLRDPTVALQRTQSAALDGRVAAASPAGAWAAFEVFGDPPKRIGPARGSTSSVTRIIARPANRRVL